MITGGQPRIVVRDSEEDPFVVKPFAVRSLPHQVCFLDKDEDSDEGPSDDSDDSDCEPPSEEEPPKRPKKPKKPPKVFVRPLHGFLLKHLNDGVRCFTKIAFRPNGVGLQPWECNVWPGFKASEVTAVDMALVQPWLDHVHQVWAAGDPAITTYLLSWIQRILLHPERPTEVGVLLKGPQGCGKTLVAQFLTQHVFGPQVSLTTTGLDKVTGRFNQCLLGKVFVNLNELSTSGDSYHSAFDKLKGLVTDPTVQLEPKGLEPFEVQNCLNFLGTTNHDFTLRMEAGDRRWACFECSGCRVGDHAYYTPTLSSWRGT